MRHDDRYSLSERRSVVTALPFPIRFLPVLPLSVFSVPVCRALMNGLNATGDFCVPCRVHALVD